MKQCFSLDPEMIPFEKTCKRVDKSTHSLPPKYDIEDRVGAQQKLLFVKGKEEYKQEFSEILQSGMTRTPCPGGAVCRLANPKVRISFSIFLRGFWVYMLGSSLSVFCHNHF